MNNLKTKGNPKISTKELLKKGRRRNAVKRAKKIVVVEPGKKTKKED